MTKDDNKVWEFKVNNGETKDFGTVEGKEKAVIEVSYSSTCYGTELECESLNMHCWESSTCGKTLFASHEIKEISVTGADKGSKNCNINCEHSSTIHINKLTIGNLVGKVNITAEYSSTIIIDELVNPSDVEIKYSKTGSSTIKVNGEKK